jgi:hypothetical protein
LVPTDYRCYQGDQMPRHKIEISQPPKSVLHSDIVFTIWSDATKLGELKISKGSADWRPANKRQAKRVPWERLAQLLNEEYEKGTD